MLCIRTLTANATMRTIKQLKDAGFSFRPAPNGADATEISSASPFSYYHTNFRVTMSEIIEHLTMAKVDHHGRYVLLLAGNWYDDDTVLPYNLLDEERRLLMLEARERYVRSMNDAQRAEADFMDAVRTDEPYFA